MKSARLLMTRRLSTVLLVDDDESSHFLTSMVIRHKGCANHIHVASSADKAIKFLTAMRSNGSLPELIIVDLRMPGMGGLELTRQIMGMQRSARTKVVIVILTNTPEEVRDQADTGYVIVLPKPLTEGGLDDILLSQFPDHFEWVPRSHWPARAVTSVSSDLDFFAEYGS